MKRKRIFIAGHNGMVGGALCRLLSKDDSIELVLRSRSELDLCKQQDVKEFYEKERKLIRGLYHILCVL